MSTKIINSYNAQDFTYFHNIDPFPSDKHSLHTHDRCEIYCVYTGSGYYITEGTRHKLQFGKVFLMRPGEFHMPTLTGNETYDRMSIHFDASFVDIIDKDRYLLRPFFERPLGAHNVYDRQSLASSKIYDIFAKMDKTDSKSHSSDIKFTILLFSLLEEINTLFDAQLYDKNSSYNSVTHKIIEYINSHLSENLSVNDICEKFYISRSQLNRNFNSHTGYPVWEYITSKRLLLARQYINDGMSLVNAAEASGFSDYSSFYRAYTKKYNTCPSEFLNTKSAETTER